MNNKYSVYYLVWEPDPQYWACILRGEKSYGYRDSEITFLEKTNIYELPIDKFLRNLLDRDVQKINTGEIITGNLYGNFGFSLSEMEYNKLKKLKELYRNVLEFESLTNNI